MADLCEEKQIQYVLFDIFLSTSKTIKISTDDLTTITFTFLPKNQIQTI
jgi:hypothetical protein